MTALAAPQGGSRDDERLGSEAMRLSSLLAAMARRQAGRAAFVDQDGREEWSGRPRIVWTYRFALDIVHRLASFFSGLGLEPGASIGICLANSSEACLTILAVEQAGLVPCLLPAAWAESDLGAALETVGLQAVVTQGVIGAERPADLFCRLAFDHCGLRFVCSFGPVIPDGVTDLDRVILNCEATSRPGRPCGKAPARPSGLVTFSCREGRPRPVFRSCQSIVASAVTLLAATTVRAGDRILSLLAPDDLRGLATGLVASLVSGATLECHGLFSAQAFAQALRSPVPTHLVAPGWMEAVLGEAGLPESIASVILVHQAPVRFKARTALHHGVVDVLAFDEMALLARARGERGQFALALDGDKSPGSAAIRNLLRVRRAEDGAIHFGGLAAEIHDFDLDRPELAPKPEWRPSGFKAELFAGAVIGVS